MWIKHIETQIFPFPYFLLKVATNGIKIKKTHQIVIEDGLIWEGISLMNACWISQWVFYRVLNAINGNGEIIFHLKMILKMLSYYKPW